MSVAVRALKRCDIVLTRSSRTNRMGPSTAAPRSEAQEKNGRAAAVTTKLKLKEIEQRVSKEAALACIQWNFAVRICNGCNGNLWVGVYIVVHLDFALKIEVL